MKIIGREKVVFIFTVHHFKWSHGINFLWFVVANFDGIKRDKKENRQQESVFFLIFFIHLLILVLILLILLTYTWFISFANSSSFSLNIMAYFFVLWLFFIYLTSLLSTNSLLISFIENWLVLKVKLKPKKIETKWK